jgi:hypothetical protein
MEEIADLVNKTKAQIITYPLNASPAATDQLLGMDDPSGSWSVMRVTIQSIIDIVIASYGPGTTATPNLTFYDSDAAGADDADEETAKLAVNMATTTEDAEDGVMEVQVMLNGAQTTYIEGDGVNDRVESKKPIVVESTSSIDKGSAISDEIPNGADPDVDAIGEHSWDSDDFWVRHYDGTNQRAIVTEYNIPFSVAEPDTMDARDYMPFFTNNTGADIIILSMYCISDDDDVDFRIEEYDADGSSNESLVKAETCDTGSGPYTNDAQTTITNATIEDGHILVYDGDDTDTPDYIHCTLWYRINGNVD